MSFFNKILSFKKSFENSIKTLNQINISKSAILNNFDIFQKMYPNYSIFPVLKSNAYWHGIKEIGTILRERKLDYIAVDSYFEAIKIQKVNNIKILLIWYSLKENLKLLNFKKVTLTIYDLETLKELKKLWKKVNIHLKIDTWMHRQWVYVDDLQKILKFLKTTKNINLEWIFSHLADADNTDNSYSLWQVELFKKWVKIVKNAWFNPKYIHLCNSAWSLKWFWKDFCNAIRLWVSLYWINPLEKTDKYYKNWKSLKLALSLYSTLVLKKELKSGEKVSYNGTFEAKKDMTIWIIPIWYYEWLSRKLSNNFEFYYKNIPLKILWRVCMNITVINLTWVKILTWDKIEIISNDVKSKNNIYSLARNSETITYESLTNLSETIRRKIR